MDRIAKEYHTIQKHKQFLLDKYGDPSKYEDSELVQKMQNIHQTMVHMRYLLSLEKEQLERERLATQSIASMRQLYGRIPFYFSGSYPPHHNSYYPLNIDWSNYVVTPNYEYQFWSDPLYKNPNEETQDACHSKENPQENTMKTNTPTGELFGMYKGHLEDVEKMCDVELEKVESRIKHLRKLRRAWDCHEVKGPVLPRKLKSKHVKRCRSNDYFE